MWVEPYLGYPWILCMYAYPGIVPGGWDIPGIFILYIKVCPYPGLAPGWVGYPWYPQVLFISQESIAEALFLDSPRDPMGCDIMWVCTLILLL